MQEDFCILRLYSLDGLIRQRPDGMSPTECARWIEITISSVVIATQDFSLRCAIPARWDFLQTSCIDRVGSDGSLETYGPNEHAVCLDVYKWHHQPSHRRCHCGFAGNDYMARFADKR